MRDSIPSELSTWLCRRMKPAYPGILRMSQHGLFASQLIDREYDGCSWVLLPLQYGRSNAETCDRYDGRGCANLLGALERSLPFSILPVCSPRRAGALRFAHERPVQ